MQCSGNWTAESAGVSVYAVNQVIGEVSEGRVRNDEGSTDIFLHKTRLALCGRVSCAALRLNLR